MKQKVLFSLWAVLFILCAGCGFIPSPEGLSLTLMTVLSLIFFLPPAMILYDAGRSKDVSSLRLIRNLSALSLGCTLLLLVLNFLAAFSSGTLGSFLHYILIIVSSPMICSGHWAMSLFLWACLLTASVNFLRHSHESG